MKKFLNFFLVVLGLCLLFGVSELAFVYKNNPRSIETYYIWRAQMVASRDLQKAINFLALGAARYNKIGKDVNPYPQDFAVTDIEFIQNSNLENAIRSYIENSDLIKLYNEDFYSYSRILYDMALIAHKGNDSRLFINLIQLATVKDPSMSYWPAELANYYYSEGNVEKAFEILTICQKNSKTKIHCSELETALKENNKAFDTGFLNDAVDNIYKHKSLDY